MPGQVEKFGELVQEEAERVRNVANEPELGEWLDRILSEKLAAAEEGDERLDKAGKWLKTVVRKALLREGAIVDLDISLAGAYPEWVGKALEAGKTVDLLVLDDGLRRQVEGVLDWMSSPEGPSAGSDWSKVSWPQAKEGEGKWLEELSKKARDHRNDRLVQEGTQAVENLADLGELSQLGESWRGWSWVQLTTPDALGKEGLLMHHCVGSYATGVMMKNTHVFSLRDPQDKPHATIELSLNNFRQARAAFNKPVAEEHLPALRALGRVVASQPSRWHRTRPVGFGQEFARCGFVHHPVLGWLDGTMPLEPSQVQAIDSWKALVPFDSKEWALALASAIKTGRQDMIEQFMPPMDASVAWVNTAYEGLLAAARMPDANILRALLKRCPSDANFSLAFKEAIAEGSRPAVEALVEASRASFDYGEMLRQAARAGKNDLAIYFLGKCASVPTREAHNGMTPQCIDVAIGSGGSVELAEAYLARVKPKLRGAGVDRMLVTACNAGKVDLALWLIPQSEEDSMRQRAFVAAARVGSLPVVEALLPLVDPLKHNSSALAAAAEGGHMDVLERLIAPCAAENYARLAPALKAANQNRHWQAVNRLVKVAGSLHQDSRLLALMCRNLEPGNPGSRELLQDFAGYASQGQIKDALVESVKERRSGFAEALLARYAAYAEAPKAGKDFEFLERLAQTALDNRMEELYGMLAPFAPPMKASVPLLMGALLDRKWSLCEKIMDKLESARFTESFEQIFEQALNEKAPSGFISSLLARGPSGDRSKLLVAASKSNNREAVAMLFEDSKNEALLAEGFQWAAYYGNTNLVGDYLKRVDPAANHSQALRDACRKKQWEFARVLAPLSNPKAYNSEALAMASAGGALELVREMLPACLPLDSLDRSLIEACKSGHFGVAKILAPHSKIDSFESEALFEAVKSGQPELIKLVLPESNVDAKRCRALREAVKAGSLEVMREIIPKTDPESAREIIKREGFEEDGEAMLLAMVRDGSAEYQPAKKKM